MREWFESNWYLIQNRKRYLITDFEKKYTEFLQQYNEELTIISRLISIPIKQLFNRYIYLYWAHAIGSLSLHHFNFRILYYCAPPWDLECISMQRPLMLTQFFSYIFHWKFCLRDNIQIALSDTTPTAFIYTLSIAGFVSFILSPDSS